ncbi:MAG: amylo-alpha-1,6-glucosidase [Dongiaceae bacterium]
MAMETELVRRPSLEGLDAEALARREWIVGNGLGGFASGTVSGELTRRYHGLLIAALPGPLGRMVMLSNVEEEALAGGGAPAPLRLVDFRLEMSLPIWRLAAGEALLEKRVVLPYRQNIVHVTYRLLEGGPLRLRLRPLLHVRPLEATVGRDAGRSYAITAQEDRYEIAAGPGLPPLRLWLTGQEVRFVLSGGRRREVAYRDEAERGYESRGPLWEPGFFSVDLPPGGEITLIAATEPWDPIIALQPADVLANDRARRRRLLQQAHPAARQGFGAELVLAADMFVFTPVGRLRDVAWARAEGDEIRTVIAGYHWFNDWGRDTMITLEGLTLATRRTMEAGWILRTFGHYVRDGLIPNMFPDGSDEGLYHTADASLWFFHALDRYLDATGDRATLRRLLPVLSDIVAHHLAGTRFGIRVDPADGLLTQGWPDLPLTWMDAKVGDWVVTPRRGKPVEINALWYNALSVLARWLAEENRGADAAGIAAHAERARAAFNARFWNQRTGHLFDIVDGDGGDDPACRSNQLLAVSLPNPVLDEARWPAVVEIAERRLLTPFGMRSLAPGEPDYKPAYFGDLRARDAAYHQGTVWVWPLGHFIDAWLKVHPGERARARAMLEAFAGHLDVAGIGSISEIFDAEPPYTPRGCIAQAWSVAEVLRCWIRTAPEAAPTP